MKTLVKSLALAFSLGFVTTAATFAETNPGGRPAVVSSFKTGVYTTISGKLNIALNKEKGGAVDILLKNDEGRVVYTQHVGKNDESYRTRLNLDQLEDGVYQLQITNGVETTTQTITLSTQHPTAPNRVVSMK
jgi:hypothetical protein